MAHARRTAPRGQAVVETALTLPLMIFLVLGTLQLFLAQHARFAAEVAVFKAARAGALTRGDCNRMVHTAVGALLPAITNILKAPGGTPQEKLVFAFAARRNNRFNPALDHRSDATSKSAHYDGPIVWLDRSLSRNGGANYVLDTSASTVGEDLSFDTPGDPIILSTELTFWFPLKIPFAGWVFWEFTMARWGNFGATHASATNPINPLGTKGSWVKSSTFADSGIGAEIYAHMAAFGAPGKNQFMMPIRTTYSMRMLTPPKDANFTPMNCVPHT